MPYAHFYKRDQPDYEFTNFYDAPIWIDGKQWPTSEHYFQAQKFKAYPQIQEAIRNASAVPPSPDGKGGMSAARNAFATAKSYDQYKSPTWDNDKDDAMITALTSKYLQHPGLTQKLLNLKPNEVPVEDAGANDMYWGAGAEGGYNILGTLIRAEADVLQNWARINPQSITILQDYRHPQHAEFKAKFEQDFRSLAHTRIALSKRAMAANLPLAYPPGHAGPNINMHPPLNHSQYGFGKVAADLTQHYGIQGGVRLGSDGTGGAQMTFASPQEARKVLDEMEKEGYRVLPSPDGHSVMIPNPLEFDFFKYNLYQQMQLRQSNYLGAPAPAAATTTPVSSHTPGQAFVGRTSGFFAPASGVSHWGAHTPTAAYTATAAPQVATPNVADLSPAEKIADRYSQITKFFGLASGYMVPNSFTFASNYDGYLFKVPTNDMGAIRWMDKIREIGGQGVTSMQNPDGTTTVHVSRAAMKNIHVNLVARQLHQSHPKPTSAHPATTPSYAAPVAPTYAAPVAPTKYGKVIDVDVSNGQAVAQASGGQLTAPFIPFQPGNNHSGLQAAHVAAIAQANQGPSGQTMFVYPANMTTAPMTPQQQLTQSKNVGGLAYPVTQGQMDAGRPVPSSLQPLGIPTCHWGGTSPQPPGGMPSIPIQTQRGTVYTSPPPTKNQVDTYVDQLYKHIGAGANIVLPNVNGQSAFGGALAPGFTMQNATSYGYPAGQTPQQYLQKRLDEVKQFSIQLGQAQTPQSQQHIVSLLSPHLQQQFHAGAQSQQQQQQQTYSGPRP